MDTYSLFAHTIASFHIDEPLDELLEFVDSQDSWVENTGEKVNRNYRSSTTHIFEHFPAIEKAVMSCVESYVNHVMFQPELRLQSTTSWMTKTKTGGYSKTHSHYNSLLSGVLHLEGSDSTDDGAFIVERPVMPTSFVLTDPVHFTRDNATSWLFPPIKNRLFVFPSYLRHAIGTHRAEHDRHSLAFNTYPVGKIGFWDSAVDILDVRGV